jgi:hypothetical protein
MLLDIATKTLHSFNVSLAPWLNLCISGGSGQGEAKISTPAGSRVPNAEAAGCCRYSAGRSAGQSEPPNTKPAWKPGG